MSSKAVAGLTVLLAAAAAWLAVEPLSAQAQAIYTCIDSKGRRLTADRPIADCLDRPQRELSPSGSVRRVLQPELTSQERAQQDARDRQAAEARARDDDERRRHRALVLRYPTPAIHDRERVAALVQVDGIIKSSNQRMRELTEQRKAIDGEFEFYAKDPSKAPVGLKRRRDENVTSLQGQKKFVQDQDDEKRRINQRFDEERVKLNQLWGQTGTAAGSQASSLPAPGRTSP